MLLVEDGRIALDDPIARWLPELASPRVVRTPQSPIDDVVPAVRPITVEDLLTFRAGWGFPSDFSLPAVVELFQRLPVFGPRETPDEWLVTLAEVPMLRQPGEAWLYNTCSDIQGVLIARVSGRPLPEFLAERVFEPLGMTDTGFSVPAEKLDRLPPYHGPDLAPVGDGSGPNRRSSRRAPAACSRRSPTGTASGRCCSRAAPALSPRSVRLDDDGPPDAGTAGGLDAVPRGSGLGLRRLRRNPTAATAGSAAPARLPTSRPPPARSASCSRSYR